MIDWVVGVRVESVGSSVIVDNFRGVYPQSVTTKSTLGPVGLGHDFVPGVGSGEDGQS